MSSKMKYQRRIICNLLAVSVCSLCVLIGEPAFATQGSTSFSAVSSVTPRGNVGFEFNLTTSSNPANCAVIGDGSSNFRLPSSTQSGNSQGIDYNITVMSAYDYNAIVATVLTAFASGRQIQVYVSGCDGDNVSLVSYVRMQ